MIFGFSLEKTWHKFVAFGIVGLMATGIDILFFNIFYFLTIPFILARYFAIFVSMIFNFTTNRNVTFSARHKKAHTQAWKFVILYVFSMSVNVFVGWCVLQILGETTLTANIAAIAGIAVSIPLNFLGSLFWVFK
jgi:putative flippase GtrA